jgi:hypothetical protein
MLARIARIARTFAGHVAVARKAQTEIEVSPVYNGETRIINVTRNAVDANGKVVLDENGKAIRETVEVEVMVSVASRYAKATRNRRNAAKRVRDAERKFALLASEMPVADVVAALRKANS